VIDFRYHLVSIVAVFLALAVGIVVGATALKPKVEAGLDRASSIEQHEINSQRAAIKQQQRQVNSDQAFAQSSAPLLLAGLLAGQRVVLVTAPGASGATITGITSALGLAGAKVTGQAQLQPAFFDTSAAAENSLDALADKVAPAPASPGAATAAPSLSAEITGQQQAAEVIAPALVNADGTDLPATETSTILSGFAQQGYLQVSTPKGASALSQATLAVVVTPASPPSSGDADPANQALLAVAEQLKLQSRGVVLAGSYPGSGAGSAIDELITGNTGVQVSSVDNANTEAGQIQVAQALSYVLAGKKPAAYGIYAGVVPSPAPTPSATPSGTPTPTPSTKNKGSG
jgi:hypothetical protein